MSGSEADRRIPSQRAHTRSRMSIDEKTSQTLNDLGATSPEAIDELFAEVTSALESERKALVGAVAELEDSAGGRPQGKA